MLRGCISSVHIEFCHCGFITRSSFQERSQRKVPPHISGDRWACACMCSRGYNPPNRCGGRVDPCSLPIFSYYSIVAWHYFPYRLNPDGAAIQPLASLIGDVVSGPKLVQKSRIGIHWASCCRCAIAKHAL